MSSTTGSTEPEEEPRPPPPPPPPRARTRIPIACTSCRIHKRRCDGKRPCENCAIRDWLPPCSYEPVTPEEKLATRAKRAEAAERKRQIELGIIPPPSTSGRKSAPNTPTHASDASNRVPSHVSASPSQRHYVSQETGARVHISDHRYQTSDAPNNVALPHPIRVSAAGEARQRPSHDLEDVFIDDHEAACRAGRPTYAPRQTFTEYRAQHDFQDTSEPSESPRQRVYTPRASSAAAPEPRSERASVSSVQFSDSETEIYDGGPGRALRQPVDASQLVPATTSPIYVSDICLQVGSPRLAPRQRVQEPSSRPKTRSIGTQAPPLALPDEDHVSSPNWGPVRADARLREPESARLPPKRYMVEEPSRVLPSRLLPSQQPAQVPPPAPARTLPRRASAADTVQAKGQQAPPTISDPTVMWQQQQQGQEQDHWQQARLDNRQQQQYQRQLQYDQQRLNRYLYEQQLQNQQDRPHQRDPVPNDASQEPRYLRPAPTHLQHSRQPVTAQQPPPQEGRPTSAEGRLQQQPGHSLGPAQQHRQSLQGLRATSADGQLQSQGEHRLAPAEQEPHQPRRIVLDEEFDEEKDNTSAGELLLPHSQSERMPTSAETAQQERRRVLDEQRHDEPAPADETQRQQESGREHAPQRRDQNSSPMQQQKEVKPDPLLLRSSLKRAISPSFQSNMSVQPPPQKTRPEPPSTDDRWRLVSRNIKLTIPKEADRVTRHLESVSSSSTSTSASPRDAEGESDDDGARSSRETSTSLAQAAAQP